ncbi:hypothetical protein BD560DRAFT_402179 [Blakeslea trispora]|nr:hypothetical protein BD560DRAFT_402179 [Blakeslea trispora]
MPKTSEFIDDEDDQSYKPGKEQVDDEEFEEQESKPVKRKREDETEKQRDKDGNQIFPLSSKRRVTIRAFSSGEGSVDLREFYLDKNTQELKPGKGICLPLAQWKKLKEHMNDIDEAIEALSSSSKKQK